MDTSMNRKSADNIFSALDKIYLAYIAYFNKSKKKQGIPSECSIPLNFGKCVNTYIIHKIKYRK